MSDDEATSGDTNRCGLCGGSLTSGKRPRYVHAAGCDGAHGRGEHCTTLEMRRV